MPEINAREERKHQWQERRDRRKQRRDERQQRRGDQGPGAQQQQPQQHAQHGQQAQHAQQAHGQAPHAQQHPPRHDAPRPGQNGARPDARGSAPQLQLQMPLNGHEHDALARVGTPLGDAAAAVFAQLRNGQPLPVRQLAAMMRKRNMVTLDPEQLWPQLKAELLGDERSYRTLGLRPRIVYRGRDLFAPGPVAMSATAEVEAAMAGALSKLAGATHRALAQRITKASPQGFERLIHAYLVAAGYREIDWIKRVGGISYATAQAPGLARTVLISARSGDQPIDRRGIGELRVGVEAKDLVAGILFAPRELVGRRRARARARRSVDLGDVRRPARRGADRDGRRRGERGRAGALPRRPAARRAARRLIAMGYARARAVRAGPRGSARGARARVGRWRRRADPVRAPTGDHARPLGEPRTRGRRGRRAGRARSSAAATSRITGPVS